MTKFTTSHKQNSLHSFTRRTALLIGGKLFLLLALIGRLFQLQILKSSEYTIQAENNRIKLSIVPPPRGIICDRHRKDMVVNQHYYRVLLSKHSLSQALETTERLSSILSLPHEKTQEMLLRAERAPYNIPIVICEYLTWEQLARIEVKRFALPGIDIDMALTRYYLYGSLAAHITGYVSAVSKEETESSNPLYLHPDFRIGRYGIEKSMNAILEGHAGLRRLEVNAYGAVVRELSYTPSTPGQQIQLTVDASLQEAIHRHLSDLATAAVVLDIQTGGILALISSPMFDPNQFTQKISHDYWETLNKNIDHPMVNKVIGNPYPPGSTFKVIVALAALEDGWNPETTVECTGGITLGNHFFRCARHQGHGHIGLAHAIESSCNVYFYHLARKIGNEKIMHMAELLGLGQIFPVDLPGMKPGLLPRRQWKKQQLHQEWTAGDTLNSGIGQGYVLATPLHLAVAAARIASGKKVIPLIVQPTKKIDFSPLPIKETSLRFVRDAMASVVNSPGGTAFRSRLTETHTMSMAGKTGTSQVVSKKNRHKMKNNSENHSLFISFGPVDQPRYACAVVVEHGGGGYRMAAPLSRAIFEILDRLERGVSLGADSTVTTHSSVSEERFTSPMGTEDPTIEQTSSTEEEWTGNPETSQDNTPAEPIPET